MTRFLFFASLMLVLVAVAPDAAADCQDCREDEYNGGRMCWSGEGGSYGSCWETGDGENKKCEGTTCKEGEDDGGGGGDGGEQPGGGGGPDDQLDPACNGMFGCPAQCATCWY